MAKRAAKLIKFLEKHGVASKLITEADDQSALGLLLLAVEQVLAPGASYYTSAQLAEESGVDPELARRLWRAMGFVDPPESEPAFTKEDLRALRSVQNMLDFGVADTDVAVQMTRVMGQSLSRIAEAQVSTAWERAAGPLRKSGLNEDELAETIGTLVADITPLVEEFVLYIWRRHLAEALKRTIVAQNRTDPMEASIAVGFCDLVGFTGLSQEMEDQDLAKAIDTFETIVYDTVGEHGGRVIKAIGDEILYVADDPADAARIGLALAERVGAEESLPEVRVGLSYGPALARGGDYLGPTVNLAHRLVAMAHPGSVVVSEEFAKSMADQAEFHAQPIRTPRKLKGIGWVSLVVLRPASKEDKEAHLSSA